jgi:heparan-alpha-glucosaminide N-acetyltransferase
MLPGTVPEVVRESNVRVASVDVYRGLVMFLMLAELLRTCAVAGALPLSLFWHEVCDQQSHAAWVGMSLHDFIQPSFYFLVGVGVFLSLARRRSKTTPRAMAAHVVVRSLTLILLGMAMVAVHPRHWSWVFTDTLTQIGLAFPFLFLIALRPKRDWYVAFAVILVGYWCWFALSPLPPPGFDYAAAGVSPEWLSAHGLTGFGAHWQKNSNVAWAFDQWFVNLFPRDTPYPGNDGGLTTLNFIPSIATMILGLIGAEVLRSEQPARKKLWSFVVTGVLLMACGWMLALSGIAPMVKAIWTPSWVLVSGGWCLLCLAACYLAFDLGGLARAAFPLTVIGANSLVAYCMSHVYPSIAFNSLRRVFGGRIFDVLGQAYEPMVYGAAVLLAYWLVLYVLYRRRIFVRI